MAGMATPTLGASQPCTVLRLYRRDPSGGLTPVPLFRTDEDHDDSAQGALELRFEDRKVAFDAMLEEDTAHDLFLTAYTGDSWDEPYGAHLEGVRLDEGNVLVRLYPLRTWSCPGPSPADDARPAPRALHAAVTVGNGDVLLLGGVTGTDIDPAGAGRDGRVGALLQSVQEVYDPRAHRFRRLTMDGGGFARVLFDVLYLGEDGPNRYRVRAIGGFELPDESAGAAVLEFDKGGVLSTFGAPFVPTDVARAAAVVDLVYDAEKLTLEVLPPDEDPFESRGAQIRISEPLANGTRVMLMGLAKAGMGWVPSTSYFALTSDSVDRHPLLHKRLGATIVPVLGDRFLVWGGNVDPMAPRVMEDAGEIIVPGGAGTALAAAPGVLPRPTAFHTATSLEDGLILITGGVSIADTGNLLELPAEDPIFGLQVMADGSVVLRDVDDAGYGPTMLHTATMVPGWGVVITGGAAVAAGMDRLTPVASVGRVPSNPLAYDGALPDLAKPRFGHRATLLAGNRLLVTGGFTRNDAERLDAVGLAELIYLAQEPYPSIQAGACIDQSSLPHRPVDAGTSTPDAGLDAGLDGGALPPMDGGGLPDGG